LKAKPKLQVACALRQDNASTNWSSVSFVVVTNRIEDFDCGLWSLVHWCCIQTLSLFNNGNSLMPLKN